MRYPRNTDHLQNARSLRKNMTRQERHLWYDCLRYCTPRFRRQEMIGNYIADFFCYDAKLIVELDGSQHYESETIKKDNARTSYFHSLGLRILRFSNLDVDTNFQGVCEAILLALKQCGVDGKIAIP